MADTWTKIQTFKQQHNARMRRLKQRRERRRGRAQKSSYDDESRLEPAQPLDAVLERKLLEGLLNPFLEFPLESRDLYIRVEPKGVREVAAREALQKFSAQGLLEIHASEPLILSVNLDRLSALASVVSTREEPCTKWPRTLQEEIEYLVGVPSVREMENRKMGAEILELLSTKSVMEQNMLEKFQSAGGSKLREFCLHKTREDCRRQRKSSKACGKLHFRKIIQSHTDESLGDCSFLNTCFHMETCKFVHYAIDDSIDEPEVKTKPVKAKVSALPRSKLIPPQWVCCDLRFFDMSCVGKFAVIMADPPWDIHMELPYGTMGDDEMRQLNIPALQDDGYIFLWVTGRAMELGRECLTLWGYERVDELVWVKTNQLQRLIRTGRTGHWINHGKEHCLVGVKGNLAVNRGIDCDVIVAEVRATSHKPDEIYGVIERLSPGTRKIELFGRQHNCQPNWLTLGNQLDGVRILEQDIANVFWARYPNGVDDTMRPPPNYGQPRV